MPEEDHDHLEDWGMAISNPIPIPTGKYKCKCGQSIRLKDGLNTLIQRVIQLETMVACLIGEKNVPSISQLLPPRTSEISTQLDMLLEQNRMEELERVRAQWRPTLGELQNRNRITGQLDPE